MEQIRAYDFDVGGETSTQPDAGSPSLSNDLVTLGYLSGFLSFSKTGTYSSPQSITAGGGIAYTGSAIIQTWYVQGSSGAVDITLNPQIAAPGSSAVDRFLLIIGTSSTNTVKLEDGAGLTLNGEIFLGAGSMILLYYADATRGWMEVCRNNT